MQIIYFKKYIFKILVIFVKLRMAFLLGSKSKFFHYLKMLLY